LRAAWRAWRRSRPFWGGLLLVLAGLELVGLPLTGVFVRGAIKLVIYIGIGGVFGVLIGVLLIAAGIVLWVNPTHRVFYGIAGIVLGIISFPASNLGGFLLGMLLAIIGGALAFAWVPADPESVAAPPASRVRDDAAGHRMLAVAAMPAVLAAGLLATGGAAKAAPSPQNGGNCILGILCPPSPSPSASPSPSPTTPSPTPSATPSTATPSSGPPASPSPSASTSASPSGTGGPSSAPTPSASASASPSASAKSGSPKSASSKRAKAARKDAAAPSGLTASAAVSVLSAASATLTDLTYEGIVHMPISGGGSEQMLKFTATSADLSDGVTVSVTQDGLTTDTTSPTLGFSGLTLYTTEFCGNIFAVLPKCFTPSTSSAVLLSLASGLAKLTPITMTDVTTDQPLATAGALQTGSLAIGF
jgi:outer membrane biosynthesis protein TonB